MNKRHPIGTRVKITTGCYSGETGIIEDAWGTIAYVRLDRPTIERCSVKAMEFLTETSQLSPDSDR